MDLSNINVVEHNKMAWNLVVENKGEYTCPVSSNEVEKAKNGEWQVVLTQEKPVPKEWFPELSKCKVLALACGGGEQTPIFAALGADITVLDNSPKQLEQDRYVAERDGLSIKTVEGDMQDLSCFEDETFDLVFNPISTTYVPDVEQVYKEVYRVLKPGGTFMTGFMNPMIFIFDHYKVNEGEFDIKHSIPFNPLTDFSKRDLRISSINKFRLNYGHSFQQLIGGQVKAGLQIIGFFEEAGNHKVGEYIPTELATCAKKPI